jgi:hypothetical protein
MYILYNKGCVGLKVYINIISYRKHNWDVSTENQVTQDTEHTVEHMVSPGCFNFF